MIISYFMVNTIMVKLITIRRVNSNKGESNRTVSLVTAIPYLT